VEFCGGEKRARREAGRPREEKHGEDVPFFREKRGFSNLAFAFLGRAEYLLSTVRA
jgi:hypothetical protein